MINAQRLRKVINENKCLDIISIISLLLCFAFSVPIYLGLIIGLFLFTLHLISMFIFAISSFVLKFQLLPVIKLRAVGISLGDEYSSSSIYYSDDSTTSFTQDYDPPEESQAPTNHQKSHGG